MKSGKALLPAMLALLTLALMAMSQASATPSPAATESSGIDVLIRAAKNLFQPVSIPNEKP